MILSGKQISEGSVIPKCYGVAYWEYGCNYAVIYPIPINLAVRFFRWVWHETIRHRPTKLDLLLREEYNRGKREGREKLFEEYNLEDVIDKLSEL